MESKFQDKNIFESGFDSFEFDDGFFLKMDSDLKNNKNTEKEINCLSSFNAVGEKTNYDDKEKNKCNFSLLIEDFNETDLYDLSQTKTNKHLPKTEDLQNNKKLKKHPHGNHPSPVLVSKTINNTALFSSTPTKPSDSDLDVDLFDDWNLEEMSKKNEQKETVTFSQALKLIEEAEMALEPDRETLNQSIDLLTGDVVSSEIGDMFEESFGLPESLDKNKDKISSSDGLVFKDFKTTRKLNFASEQDKVCDSVADKKNHCFSSDDDFDYLTQDLLEKSKKVSEYHGVSSSPENQKTRNPIDLNDSTDAILLKKRGKKCFQVIESDTSEDSPSPKFKNKITKRKNFKGDFGNEFIELEAEVSDDFEVSCDEAEEEGEYDKSFLDEESYFSQNHEADMTAKYLESVKTVTRHGSFKIPETKPFNPANVFSQTLEDTNTDYEINSFCVNDVEEEIKTDLSDLEVAEKLLERDRKKRKKKRIREIKT